MKILHGFFCNLIFISFRQVSSKKNPQSSLKFNFNSDGSRMCEGEAKNTEQTEVNAAERRVCQIRGMMRVALMVGFSSSAMYDVGDLCIHLSHPKAHHLCTHSTFPPVKVELAGRVWFPSSEALVWGEYAEIPSKDEIAVVVYFLMVGSSLAIHWIFWGILFSHPTDTLTTPLLAQATFIQVWENSAWGGETRFSRAYILLLSFPERRSTIPTR